jgi:ASC-1-like (ASCH) protein
MNIKIIWIKNSNTFERIKNKIKVYEIRVYYGFIKKINRNDIIMIKNNNNFIKVKITDINYYKNFKELFSNIDYIHSVDCKTDKMAIEYMNNLYKNIKYIENECVCVLKLELI